MGVLTHAAGCGQKVGRDARATEMAESLFLIRQMGRIGRMSPISSGVDPITPMTPNDQVKDRSRCGENG